MAYHPRKKETVTPSFPCWPWRRSFLHHLSINPLYPVPLLPATTTSLSGLIFPTMLSPLWLTMEASLVFTSVLHLLLATLISAAPRSSPILGWWSLLLWGTSVLAAFSFLVWMCLSCCFFLFFFFFNAGWLMEIGGRPWCAALMGEVSEWGRSYGWGRVDLDILFYLESIVLVSISRH